MSGQPAVAQVAPPATLGPLRWWELEEVQALERDLFGAEGWTPAQFWSELARIPESRWYVTARVSGRIVGYAGVFVVGTQADVQTVAVDRGMQGRGIGQQLVEALADHAARRGATVLHLEVRADNGPALALYGRMGFTADGRRRDYYGRGHDAVLMSLRLAGRGDANG